MNPVPEGHRSEKHLKAMRENRMSSKRAFDPDALVDAMVTRVTTGQSLVKLPQTGPMTKHDRLMIVRVAGCTAEEFQAKFSERLRVIADKAANRIEEKLDEGGQKLGDLNMTMAITVDKLSAMNAKPTQGNLSVQINNYGSMTRDQLLASLRGEKVVLPEPPPPSIPPDMDVI